MKKITDVPFVKNMARAIRSWAISEVKQDKSRWRISWPR